MYQDIYDNSCFKKAYTFCFFLLGFTWLLPKWHYLAYVALIGIYTLDNGLFRGRNVVGRPFLTFFAGCTLFFLHAFIPNLIELLRFGYIPYSSVYHGFEMIKRPATLFVRLAVAYILFQHTRKSSGADLFFQSFSFGNIFFSLSFIALFGSFAGDLGGGRLTFLSADDVMLIHPNQLGISFLLFFYSALIAFHSIQSKVMRFLYFLGCVFAVAIIVLAQSRGSFFALLLGLSLGVLSSGKMTRVLFLGVGIVVLGLGLYIADVPIEQFLPRRFTPQYTTQVQGSGRSEIWHDYIEHATLTDWMVGHGYFTNDQDILYQKPVRGRDSKIITKSLVRRGIMRDPTLYYTHNIYLEIALRESLFCLFIYCSLIVVVSWKLLKKVLRCEASWIYLAMWSSSLLCYLVESGFLSMLSLLYWATAISQCSGESDMI